MEVQRILLHFKRSEVIETHNGITFIFYPGLPHTLQPLDSLMQGLSPKGTYPIPYLQVYAVQLATHPCTGHTPERWRGPCT